MNNNLTTFFCLQTKEQRSVLIRCSVLVRLPYEFYLPDWGLFKNKSLG